MSKPFLVGVSQFTVKDSTQAGWKQKANFKELDPRVCIIKWQATKSGKRRWAKEDEKRSIKAEEKHENHEERTRNIGNTEGPGNRQKSAGDAWMKTDQATEGKGAPQP